MRLGVGALHVGALLAIANCSAGSSAGPGTLPPCTFTNPIAPGADPWVVRENEAYYFVASRDNAIWVQKTTKLTEIGSGGVKVWQAPGTGWNHTNVWAPELHHVDGRWYIYYAAGSSGPPYITQRAGVLQSVTDDPLGAYSDRGMLYTGDDVATAGTEIWAIDLTVLTVGARLYAVWSGWEQNASTDRTPQHLYIAPMANPWTIAANRVKISSPTESWELGTELNLLEGPESLVHGDQIFLIYSTRESWLSDYRLGQLRLKSSGADPLDPASWVKTGPIFTGTSNIFGVGHASFTTSPDGTEQWIAYHTKVNATPGWERVIRLQPYTWNADGSPHFGTPVPSSQPLAVPSGQCR